MTLVANRHVQFNAGSKVVQIEQLWKELINGTFDLTMPFCHVTQRLTDRPIIQQGAGFVAQDRAGRLRMRFFSPISIDQNARNYRQKLLHLTVGLPVDAFAFDITAKDIHNAEWSSRWQTIEERLGTGTEVSIELTEIAKVEACTDSMRHREKRWLAPGEFHLPGGRRTEVGGSISGTTFSGECDGTHWHITQIQGGIDIRFWVDSGPLDPRSTYFLWALQILLGRVITPFITHYAHAGTLITLIKSRNRALEEMKLLNPVFFSDWIPTSSATEFIHCFIRMRQDQDVGMTPLGVIFQFWHRMLRADQDDVENVALIVSVGIEGIVKANFQSELDVDHDLLKFVDDTRSIINSIDINKRVRVILLNSLENAGRFRMKDALKKLVDQGAITNDHVKAWTYLRNSTAHGTVPRPGDISLQSHLDKFRCCLDLFYRLTFLAVGYRGLFRDRSSAPWRTRVFSNSMETRLDSAASGSQQRS